MMILCQCLIGIQGQLDVTTAEEMVQQMAVCWTFPSQRMLQVRFLRLPSMDGSWFQSWSRDFETRGGGKSKMSKTKPAYIFGSSKQF